MKHRSKVNDISQFLKFYRTCLAWKRRYFFFNFADDSTNSYVLSHSLIDFILISGDFYYDASDARRIKEKLRGTE